MTAAYRPAEVDHMYAFIATGSYLNGARIPSEVLSRAIGRALSAEFAEPTAVNSYIMPRMVTPLTYDLRTVWTTMSEFARAHVKEIQPELFNAIVLLLKAVPEREADASDAQTGHVAAANSSQVVSG